MAGNTTQHWWEALNAAGVPAGPVYSVPEALAHPQIAERGMLATYPDVPGVGRDVRIVRTGIKLDGQAPSVSNPPPQLGEHTDRLLAELGYGDQDIQALRQEGAV